MVHMTDSGNYLYDDDYEILVGDAKPCPFCGNRSIRTKTAGFYEMLEVSALIMDCPECGCSMTYYARDDGEGQKPYDTAFRGCLATWNRRTAG